MRRLLCLVLLWIAVPAFAQYPEVDAAVDALMAKDLYALGKHLPPGLEKGLADLTANEQRELSEELLPSRTLRRQGMVVRRSDSPEAIVVIEPIDPNRHNEPVTTIKLYKRISDGSECLLRLVIEAGGSGSGQFQVWLRYIDSEWRVYELEDEAGRKVELDTPDFLAKRRHTELNANEASAIGSIRSYNTAAVTYASSYPDIGCPRTAEDLGESRYGTDVDPHHAGLLDSQLTTAPFEKNGYRFSFQGAEAEYTVIARPIKFGVSGKRSFFSDQSGVIRSTEKDEEPTERDEPLQ